MLRSVSGGSEANRQGQDMARAVKDMLGTHGYSYMDLGSREGVKAIAALKAAADVPRLEFEESPGVMAERVPLCVGLHGGTASERFLLYRRGWPDVLALAVRHQTDSGTAIQKLEYLFAEITECYPCRCLVILDGPAHTPGVLARARSHVLRSRGKVATIFEGLGSFRRWLADGSDFPAEVQMAQGQIF